jgi:hypothetical protein
MERGFQKIHFQEVLNDFPFSNFLNQLDGKSWRLQGVLNNGKDDLTAPVR